MNNANPVNKGEMFDLLNSLEDYYGSKPASTATVNLYVMGLTGYTQEQVQAAVGKHMQNPRNGQFFPKVADLVKYINGLDLSTDQIIAMARLKNCPLGVMAAIQIGSYDLDNQDSFYLKQRAEEVLQLIPEWKEKANNGEYSEHQLRTMIKYDVEPASPFHAGLLPPRESYRIGMAVNALAAPIQDEQPKEPVKIHTEEEKREIIQSIGQIGYKPSSH